MRPINRSLDHMESLNSDVKQICPTTGDIIAPVKLSKRYVVKMYLIKAKRPIHPLDKYQQIGIKMMTTKQIEAAYGIIKGLKCKIV